MEFREIADRVWVHRAAWFDLNIVAIGGRDGVVVVDPHGSTAAGRQVRDAVAALGAGPVRAVINTHEHFDHTFGNAAFREVDPDVPLHAHEVAAERTRDAGERVQRAYAEEHPDDERTPEVLATEIVPADHTFSSVRVLDLGDRALELVHPGRGHTAGDLVVRIGDADVLLAGDLVEESAPPALGADSHPMDWPLSLDTVLSLTTPATVVVPGHGALVDRAFVEEQRNLLGIVAETIRDLAGRGVPLDQALEVGEWPYPREVLADAVARGYADLPRAQKRLPLV